MPRKNLNGPARKYRRSPERYEAVHHTPVGATRIALVTKLGCRDALRGQKNPYKPEARGLISAYREGYRICERLDEGRGRTMTDEERRVARKFDLEFEVKLAERRRLFPNGLGRSRSKR